MTIALLNKVTELGFSREKALVYIDTTLDNLIGLQNRKPIMEEEISDRLADDIFTYFKFQKEMNE